MKWDGGSRVNDLARANGRTFLILSLLGVGSLSIWGLATSFFTLAPFIKFLHSCSRMLAVPKFYLWIGLLGLILLGYFLGSMLYTALRQQIELKKYLASLTFISRNPEKLNAAILRTGTQNSIFCVESTSNLAFTYGLLRPKIIVSTSLIELLDEDELVAVLLHEICHCRQSDPLKLYTIRFLFSKVWRIKLIADLTNFFLFTMELRADEYATRLSDRSWSLASALLKVIQSDIDLPQAAIGVTTVLDARVERCLNQEWMPNPALKVKDKLILLGYTLFLALIVTITYQNLMLGFGCHINFLS